MTPRPDRRVRVLPPALQAEILKIVKFVDFYNLLKLIKDERSFYVSDGGYCQVQTTE